MWYYLIAIHLNNQFLSAEPSVYTNVVAKYETLAQCNKVKQDNTEAKSMTFNEPIEFVCIGKSK